MSKFSDNLRKKVDEAKGLVQKEVHGELMLPEEKLFIDGRTPTTPSAPLALNTQPFGLLNTRIGHLDKQIRHIGMQAAKQMAVDTAQFNYANHQGNLELQHRTQVAQQIVLVLDARQKAELTQIATAHKLDNIQYLAWRMEELKMDIGLRQLAETNRLELEKTERLKQIDFEYQQKTLDAETDATIRLANTDNLTRAQSLAMIEDYDKKLRDPNLSARMRQNYEREITKLEQELFSEPSGMAGKADAGEEPTGGAPPPQSGSDPQSPAGKSQQRPRASTAGHVN